MYKEEDQGILIEVRPEYVKEESMPDHSFFFFAYHVEITSHREDRVRLTDRHWIISDGDGRVEEVKGEGVIGQKPVFEKNKVFTYSSACPLPTKTGNMRGYYTFETSSGEKFKVKIPLFFLRTPDTFH